jgi:predicted sulfurtransferase
MMQLIDHQAIRQFGDEVICLDIRAKTSYNFLRMEKGVKIPYDQLGKNLSSITAYRHLPVVIFSTNCPSRCNRASIAEKELRKAGFSQVFGINGGIIKGWSMPTQSSSLPGIEL